MTRLIFCVVLAMALLSTSCEQNQGDVPDALQLSDLIAESAIGMNRNNETGATVEHQLALTKDSLIVVVPREGLTAELLPKGTTDEQISQLKNLVKTWSGQGFVAILWDTGVSSGPGIDRHIAVSRQLSVRKPPQGRVRVTLRRLETGIEITSIE